MPSREGQNTGGDDRNLDAVARELLRRAWRLIGDPSAWTRRHYARDRHSHPVSPSSERAVRFCVGGALLRAASEQFSIQFKIGSEADAMPDEPWAKALGLAYRYLGDTLARLHLRTVTESLHDERADGEWRVTLSLQREGEESPTVVTAPWPFVVHTINDHPRVKHQNILMALALAQMATFREASRGAEAGGRFP